MGYGKYSETDRAVRTTMYCAQSAAENFKQREVIKEMNSLNLKVRESRDSEEHPKSLAIILALDLTGSMGSVPQQLVTTGFSTIMSNIIQKGKEDAQVLFLGVGDHTCDRRPLQVGQFETNDELLDKWLTSIYLEGGGGANDGESYLMAWFTAAFYTDIDCFNKRKEKGFLFTIGDEPTLKTLEGTAITNIIGEGQSKNYTAVELLEEARKKYNVFHIHLIETRTGQRWQSKDNGWKQLMGDDLIICDDHTKIPNIIADIINRKAIGSSSKTNKPSTSSDTPVEML